jgi:dTDP-4-dehydrorhamnose 3,5-epimerase
MTIIVERLSIPGLLLVRTKKFSDARGFFSETYNARDLAAHNFDRPFVQDNHSYSVVRGTVRGLHFQRPPDAQDKLIRVLRGSIFDVVVDIRVGSPTFGKHFAIELSAENWAQLLVPVGLAHGFCTLTGDVEVLYKATSFYSPAADDGIQWQDPELQIPWPAFAGAELSKKDQSLPKLAEIQSPFVFDAP